MRHPLTKEDRIKMRFVPAGYFEYQRINDTVVYASPDMLSAIAYKGSSMKFRWFFSFPSVERCLILINEFFQEYNDELRRKTAKKEFTTSLKPGDILVSTWGYDQTNADFYQIIEIRGKKDIIIRQICATVEETGFMCGYAMPRPGVWAHDSLLLRKRTGPAYTDGKEERVSITPYSSAYLWDGKKVSCSWYA